MARILVSGGAGLVGRYLVDALSGAGHEVIVGGCRPPAPGLLSSAVGFVPLDLDPATDNAPAFDGIDHFVHAAFAHVPGKYRGGEGDDPAGFLRLNLDGTIRLFEAAKAAGVARAIFLSSRAVYDGVPGDMPLSEDLPLAPANLYAKVKLEAEAALAALCGPDFAGASLRATGVYGPLRPNKWDGLFADYLAGRPVAARAGTEVHGADLAAAARLLLGAEPATVTGRAFNASDITVDTRDILAPLKAAARCPHPLPDPAPRETVRAMPTGRLAALGWRPGGRPLFDATMAALSRSVAEAGSARP